jgi:hypothetical protein
MNLMKKRKIGLMMGAGLLLTGAGVAVAMTTTSCSNDKKSGLEFEKGSLKATKKGDETSGYSYELQGKATAGIGENDTMIYINSSKNGKKPDINKQDNL